MYVVLMLVGRGHTIGKNRVEKNNKYQRKCADINLCSIIFGSVLMTCQGEASNASNDFRQKNKTLKKKIS